MALRFGYCILLFNVLLLMSDQAKGIREIQNQEHTQKNVKDMVNEKSLQLYYKILNELSKRPAVLVRHGLPGKRAEFDDFVFEFYEASYIGLFTPKSIHVGKVMPIYFPIEDHSLPFTISKEMVDSHTTYPLSDLSKIFKPLSGLQDSPLKLQTEADQCMIHPEEAETKTCVRDIESINKFVRRAFKSEGSFKIVETKQPEMSAGLLHEYTVLGYPQEIQGPRKVFCHPMSHGYYCHYSDEAKVVKVPLSTENGDKMEAIGVCHDLFPGMKLDSIIYRWLNIKPGSTDTVCHLLPMGHFVWVQSPTLEMAS